MIVCIESDQIFECVCIRLWILNMTNTNVYYWTKSCLNASLCTIYSTYLEGSRPGVTWSAMSVHNLIQTHSKIWFDSVQTIKISYIRKMLSVTEWDFVKMQHCALFILHTSREVGQGWHGQQCLLGKFFYYLLPKRCILCLQFYFWQGSVWALWQPPDSIHRQKRVQLGHEWGK